MNEDRRGPWYLLTGLVIGLALGITYAWVVSPVEYVDTSPSSLRSDFKDQFRALIAVAYLSSGNLERARVRLDYLGDDGNASQTLALLAQRALAAGQPESEIQALGMLSAALNGEMVGVTPPADLVPSVTLSPAPTQTPTPLLAATPTPSGEAPEGPLQTPQDAAPRLRGTPTFTPTLLPTRTPTLTPGAPFVLQNRELVCDLNQGEALILVEVRDASQQPVPGVEIIVRWEGGEDHFLTGLKPEINQGFADFAMTPGVEYNLQLATGGELVTGITALECEGQAGRFWGNWRLSFIQP